MYLKFTQEIKEVIIMAKYPYIVGINGKWYPAGTEVPETVNSEEKPRRGRPPKSDNEWEEKE